MNKLERIELDLKTIRERLGGDSEIPTLRPLPYNQVEEEIYRALLFIGESYASEIARATSRDERTVGKYLRVLETRGIIECIRVEGRKHDSVDTRWLYGWIPVWDWFPVCSGWRSGG